MIKSTILTEQNRTEQNRTEQNRTEQNRTEQNRTERESNFELLRLFSIYGIICMHLFGSIYNEVTGINLCYGVLINTVFNMGVTIFMLISGFFGIKYTTKKFCTIWIATLFYSVTSMTIIACFSSVFSVKAAIKSLLPISSGTYWFITAYMLIMIFSKWLNKVPEELSKQSFQKLISIMLCIFSVLPTIIQVHIMNDDGKGIMNMLLVYFVGRYIKIYGVHIKHTKLILFGLLLVQFGLNYVLSLVRGGVGVYAPFARDCSILILAGSVCTFLVFRDISFRSRAVNLLAKGVIGVYLFEGAIRTILSYFICIDEFLKSWYLSFMVFGLAFAVMTICLLIEFLREHTLAYVEIPVSKAFTFLCDAMTNKIRKFEKDF